MVELKDALEFMLAGKAIFTVRNEQTKNRFTFKIEHGKRSPNSFVKVLNGSDNETSYRYMGTIFAADRQFVHTKNSPIGADAQSVKVFKWFWKALQENKLPPWVKVYHEGRCGRCGRKLTVPESVTSGYGPECQGRR